MNNSDLSVRHKVIENLETLSNILENLETLSNNLEIRLYDTIPSMAIYRAGDYLLASVFFHGLLAVDTFQLELDLSKKSVLSETIINDFNEVWEIAREFTPYPPNEWQGRLRILFNNGEQL